MPKLLTEAVDPYSPEDERIHAGKVFVLPQGVLAAVNTTSSDGSAVSELKDRLMLCLWDVDDATSVWISLQSDGDFEVTHANKRLAGAADPNWMDEDKVTHYRNGTLWLMGKPGRPVNFSQKQKHSVTNAELDAIRANISRSTLDSLIRDLED